MPFCFSVCACGKWVCTSNKCSQGYSDIFSNHINSDEAFEDSIEALEQEDEDSLEDLDDEDDDYSSPEDDPDVQDINWF